MDRKRRGPRVSVEAKVLMPLLCLFALLPGAAVLVAIRPELRAWVLGHEAPVAGLLGAGWRRAAFRELLENGRAPDAFAIGEPTRTIVDFGKTAAFGPTVAFYQSVQEAHADQESLDVSLPEGSSGTVEHLLRSLPRVRVDRTVRAAKGVPPGGLIRPSAPMRKAGSPSPGRVLLRVGDISGALAVAQKAVTANVADSDSRLMIVEIARGAGKPALMGRLIAESRAADPGDPRLAILERDAVLGDPGKAIARRLVEAAWNLLGDGALPEAGRVSALAISAGGGADAHLAHGLIGIETSRRPGQWLAHGQAIRSLREAVRLGPGRLDLLTHLANSLVAAGGTIAEAPAVLGRVLALEADNALEWCLLGIAHLGLGNPGDGEAAFREGLRRDPLDRNLLLWLGHAIKRQGRIDEAHECYARHLGGSHAPQGGPPNRRRVVFLVQNSQAWPCMESVYEAFRADPSWETVLVALPWNHPAFDFSTRADDRNKVFAFLKEKGLPHVRWEDYPLEKNRPDLVFVQNPYDATRPDGWKVENLVRAGHRLCYVPYAIEIGGNHEDVLYQFNMPLQVHAWAVFARSEDHRRLFATHCQAGNAHVHVTGHPKFDLMGAGEAARPSPDLVAFARGRRLVLWNPHFDVRLNATRFGDGYSTFLFWKDAMIDLFARRQDLAFVVRPHPSFFPALEHRGFMDRAEADAYVASAEKSGNIRFDASGDYYRVLAAADALISDCSSLQIEFGISGKPVCYTHNPNGPMSHLDYELDMDFVRQHQAWALCRADVEAFLDRVAAGTESRSEARAADLRRRMGIRPGGAAPLIKAVLEERLAQAT